MKLKIVWLILVLPFILVSQPGDVLRVKAVGKSSQDIKQGSMARAMALRAATLEGYRKIAEQAGLVKTARTGDREYKWAQVFLKGTKIVSKKYISDHEVEIVMEIPISQLEKTAAEFKAYAAEKERTQLKKEIDALEKKINILKSQLEALKKKLEKIE
jgi:HAMP domain-containing protein